MQIAPFFYLGRAVGQGQEGKVIEKLGVVRRVPSQPRGVGSVKGDVESEES